MDINENDLDVLKAASIGDVIGAITGSRGSHVIRALGALVVYARARTDLHDLPLLEALEEIAEEAAVFAGHQMDRVDQQNIKDALQVLSQIDYDLQRFRNERQRRPPNEHRHRRRSGK